MGASLVRKLLDAPEEGLIPVGFIDDDPNKLGRKIHGVPVLGASSEIERILRAGVAERVLLASKTIGTERIVAVVTSIGKERLGRIRFVVEEIPRLPAPMGDA
jgi:FlaA1/EpsC-like NDP-sugar epimerase